MTKHITRTSVVLAATAAGLAVATAAAAVLPGAASDTAREHTAEVTIPGPNEAAGDAPEAAAKTVRSTAGAEDAAEGTHGATVSDLATSTTLTGAEKGAAIAAVASDGRSEARGSSGDHAAGGEAKAAEASAKGQEASAAHRP